VDTIDRRILALFQHDTRRIAGSIGAEVGLSAAAVQRRLKRLRENGVILREVALVDPRAVGIAVTCVVLLTMVARPRQYVYLDRFKQRMRESPMVQQCYQVTGSSDLMLLVSAGSVEEYSEFARRWFESSEDVARYETLVVQDRVKVGLSLPVAVEEAATESRASAPAPVTVPRRRDDVAGSGFLADEKAAL
jgi:Lrp/AsnC family transcriptional regulator, leucine-responsive regulatory protein